MKPLPSLLAYSLSYFFVCAPVFAQATSQPAQEVKEPREITIRYGPYKPPSATFAVESNLVELRVTVRDAKGRPVAGLAASDFQIFDNNGPRPVEFFSEEKSPAHSPESPSPRQKPERSAADAAPPSATHPRCIALFIDDTHGGIRPLDQSKRAAEKFISSGMQPSDRVAIFTDSGTVTVDFTSDSAVLLAGLGRVTLHVQRGAAPLSDCPTLTAYQAYVIANHLDQWAKDAAVAEAISCKCLPDDKVCIANQDPFVDDYANAIWVQSKGSSLAALDVLRIAVRQLAAAPEERILVILSPGFVTGDMQPQTSAILDAALRARIIINSIDSEGMVSQTEYPEGRRIDPAVRQMVLPEFMAAAAAATGGQFIMNTNDVIGRMQAVVSVPEVSYLLGFTPVSRPDDKYHELKVKLSAAGNYTLQSRAGYFYAEKKDEGSTAQERINREAFTRDQLAQIPVVVHASPHAAGKGPATILVVVSVDVSGLKFATRGGRKVQQLTFLTLLEDCTGNLIAGKEAIMDLYLKPKTLARFKTEGLHATLTFPAPKAPYQIREVVRDTVQDHIAAANASTDCR